MTLPLIFFIICLLLLQAFPAWADNPALRPKQAAPPPSWQELKSPDTAVLKDFQLNPDFPASRWWEGFGDPNLNRYVVAGLSANPNLELAMLRISESRQLYVEARSALLPYITTQPSYQRLRLSSTGALTGAPTTRVVAAGANFNFYAAPLTVNYELDLFGKNRLIAKSAQKTVEEYDQLWRTTKIALVSDIAAAYFNLIKTDALLASTQQLIDTLQKTLSIQQKLYRTGVIPYDAILLAEQDLAQYQQNLAQYQGQQGVFTHQLTLLMGGNPENRDDIHRFRLDQLPFPKTIPTGIPSELLRRRPDIVEREVELQQAGINVSIAKRAFFPTINLIGEFGFDSTQFSKLFDWQSRIYELGGSLFQELYTGGAKMAEYKRRKIILREQIESYRGVLLTAFQEVEDSLATLKADYGAYQGNLAQIASSKRAMEINDVRYRTGVGTYLDWLNVKRQFLIYQTLAVQDQGNSLLDIVQLYHTLGGGSAP